MFDFQVKFMVTFAMLNYAKNISTSLIFKGIVVRLKTEKRIEDNHVYDCIET